MEFVGYGLSQALRFGSNLVMTRLLVPDAFALMAIATVVMIGLTMFSDLGLKPIIIQSTRGNDAKFLNTAWTVQIIRGAFLWLIAIGISFVPLLASSANLVAENSVYADPRLPYVIVALSFSLFIGGLNSTKIFEASRRTHTRSAHCARSYYTSGWAILPLYLDSFRSVNFSPSCRQHRRSPCNDALELFLAAWHQEPFRMG